MQELQIPNGYFQLWNMYLIEQGIDFHQLGFLAQYQYELEHVLQLPIDTQSPFSFFQTIYNWRESSWIALSWLWRWQNLFNLSILVF